MINPIEMEIMRGALESTILEMRALIDRTAMSPIIKEKKDYFAGIYDAKGRMLAAHIVYTGPGLLDPLLKTYPAETMQPGDVYWYNDPYLTDGAIQHLGDMCFVVPVFADGEVVAFSAAFGHFKDIGGSRSGSISPGATEIFHEGVRVPPIKIQSADGLNESAYRLFLANSRFPMELEGDTRAIMAAALLGGERLDEMVGRFGKGKLLTAWGTLIDRTEAAARKLLRDLIPEGEYEFWDCVDDDYITGRPYEVNMRLVREGDRVVVDLTDSAAQAKGPINFLTTHGFMNLLFGRYLMALDESLPLNEGLLNIIDETRVKPGTVVSPRFPAPTGLRSHTRLRLSSCLLGVVNLATEGKAPANSPVYALYDIRFFDGATGKYDVCAEGVGSGLGARPYADGTDAIYFVGQKNFPIEFLEQEHPIRILEYGIHKDSGGAGYYRGGCGVVRVVEVLADGGVLATRFDNSKFPCWGAAGGQAGRPAKVTVNPGTPEEKEVPLIGDDYPVKKGDILRIEACGGGGWGNPAERPAAWVQRDVRQGFVSVDAARDEYGVVLHPDTLEIDEDETKALRWEMLAREPEGLFDRGGVLRPEREDVSA